MATAQMSFSAVIKKEGDDWVAHCLELDIVTTADSPDRVQSDLLDLIMAQLDYALANDNLDHFYKPAPESAWREFFACDKKVIVSRDFVSQFKTQKPTPSSIATTTGSPELCYAS